MPECAGGAASLSSIGPIAAAEAALATLRTAIISADQCGVPETTLVLCVERAIVEIEKHAKAQPMRNQLSPRLTSSSSMPAVRLVAPPPPSRARQAPPSSLTPLKAPPKAKASGAKQGDACSLTSLDALPMASSVAPPSPQKHKPSSLAKADEPTPLSLPPVEQSPSRAPPPKTPGRLRLRPSVTNVAFASVVSQADRQMQFARGAAHMLGALRARSEASFSSSEQQSDITQQDFCETLKPSYHILSGYLKELPTFAIPPETLFSLCDQDKVGAVPLAKINATLRNLLRHDGLGPAHFAVMDEMLASGHDVMKVTVDEMVEILKVRASEVYSFFQAWDTNQDGILVRDEFVAAGPWIGLGPYLKAEVEGAFDYFDSDRSGELSLKELFRVLKFTPARRRRKPQVVEKPVDLTFLRKSTLENVVLKGAHLWGNEVPPALRSKASFSPNRANPSIGYTIL